MSTRLAWLRLAPPIALAIAAGGCGGGPTWNEALGRRADAIVGGTEAPSYEEAAQIDLDVGVAVAACSGVVVARHAVLTAAHCIDGVGPWIVRAPYAAGGQEARATYGVTFDYAGLGGPVAAPDAHDVGLILLDAPIELAEYPAIAAEPLADGSVVAQLGRIHIDDASSTGFYESQPLLVFDATSDGFPNDYITNLAVGEPGDSGGPVVVPGPSPRTVVAVASTAVLLARVDPLHDWIPERIAAHEAEIAAVGAGGAGGAGGATPTEPAPTPEPTPKADAGTGAAADAGDDVAGAQAEDVAVASCAVGPVDRSTGLPLGAIAAAALAASRRARRAVRAARGG